jgi:hypothetical protein
MHPSCGGAFSTLCKVARRSRVILGVTSAKGDSLNRGKLILLFLAVTGLLVVGFFVHSVVNTVTVVVPNAYAIEWAAVFIIEHMEANQNRWPRSWADLKDEYDQQVASGHPPAPTWQELQSRVQIDWNVDVRSLAMADAKNHPPFRALWLSDGTNSHWEGSEPNHNILQYLLNKSDFEDQK